MKDKALKLALDFLLTRRMGAEALIVEIQEALAPPEQEIDWKDMYEKEKRRSAMWVAKYEKDIRPLEKAVPVTQEPAGLIESLKYAKPCCGQYETCYRACTPRGKFLGQRDAQRPWVGIDSSEIPDEEFDRTAFTDGATWAERYLKEKNS